MMSDDYLIFTDEINEKIFQIFKIIDLVLH